MTTLRELAEVARRWWCRRAGHDWREDGGPASPVLGPILVCRRCGKFERRRVEDPLDEVTA